ncbi:MAG: alpha/beta hydrolase [Clostridiales bacterium]|nr:alpha/beta hydrolase [Clostridiales bacterium]
MEPHPTRKRPHLAFVLMMLMVYLPVFFALSMIRAEWYGWVAVALSFGLLFWMHSRSFWHSWRIVLCFLSAFAVALAGLSFSRPEWDVSLSAQLSRGIVRTFSRLPAEDQAIGRTLLAERGWTPPEGYELTVVPLPNARLELLRKTGSASDRAILQFHGGAFVSGLNDLYREFAVRYSRIGGDSLVATLDYRLAPAWPYPSQQSDAMDAWQYMTKTLGYPAENVIVVGDSAGGNLALSLGLRLRDQALPMPRGIVCMSPWADLSNSGPSHITNATVDPSFGVDARTYDGRPVGVTDSTYADGLDAADPYLSPSFGNYEGFPPMLLQAGSIEILLSDSEMVYENARDHGVDCALTVYKGMFHVFQGAMDLLPESKSAWEEIERFFNETLR